MYDVLLSLIICFEVKEFIIILFFGILKLSLDFIVPLLHLYGFTLIFTILVLLYLGCTLLHLLFFVCCHFFKILLKVVKLASRCHSILFITQILFATILHKSSKLFQNVIKRFLELAFLNSDACTLFNTSFAIKNIIVTYILVSFLILMLLSCADPARPLRISHGG